MQGRQTEISFALTWEKLASSGEKKRILASLVIAHTTIAFRIQQGFRET